ncbi:MAG TPA: hypothetical protein VFN10_23920 [Thermoanaerobaculia bacterium]|nr:hypothetical protein [Thermoanaerobaculia bacterium]
MKKVLVSLFVLALTIPAFAQNAPDINSSNPNAKKFMMRGYAKPGGGGTSNLSYHTGGVVIRNANVVFIFWGSAFGSGGSDAGYAAELQAFRNQFGSTGEYRTVVQYYGEDPVSGYGNIATGSLVGQADWFDGTNPPQNVTDATVQSEVKKYVANFGVDYNAVYEVILPKTSFSSDGSSASCGATSGYSLAYCAYHSHYTDASGKNVKYSIEPYPSCSGCTVSGWTAAQNQEHFVTHETREAVTDALGNAWFDRRGYEADDKCAWTPTPFIGTGGYGYQYEWSNADNGCVQTK